ncbi:hypothetical protein ACTNEO_19990 [Gracilibacillus sp. HCP3S3_G5_1]|uniref:hypothetical protein n=1 Tax=unclassified Gracilibacillus TaxID=2625209 RepID=UPI003F89B0B0
MGKSLLSALIFGWFVKTAVAIALGVTWLLNTLTVLSISYILIGCIVAGIYVLGLIYSLLIYKAGKSTFDTMYKKYGDW